MFSNWKNFFSKSKTRLTAESPDLANKPYPFTHQLETNHSILPAFNLNGTQYYHIADKANMPTGRMLDCLEAMQENDMGMDRTTLQGYMVGIENALNPLPGERIKTGEAAALVREIKERLTYAFDTDLVLRIASLVFFDETESPYKADVAYCRVKEERFREECREDAQLRFFFQRLGLAEYMPLLAQHGTDLQDYTQMQRMKKEQALDSLLPNIYSRTENRQLYASLLKEKTTLKRLSSLPASDGGTTTFIENEEPR